MENGKIISAEQAIEKIKDGDTIAFSCSGGGLNEPDKLIKTLSKKFKKTKKPKNITFVHATGIGNKKGSGMDYLAIKGLVKRDISGHWGYEPKMLDLAINNEIEAYNLPQGVLSQLFREIASGRPGLITKVGLKTFVDPRVEGGKLNSKTKEDLVKNIEIYGEDYLFYTSFNINIALLRGTTSDLDGNITFEKEGAFLDNLSVAQATHNSDGIVIVQVERIAEKNSLNPQQVKIPGMLVDYIVLNEHQMQTCITNYNPGYSGEIRVPVDTIPKMPLNYRKIVARRALFELVKNGIINLGVGIADGVALVAAEENIFNNFSFVVEQGLIGGVPAKDIEFGASLNPSAIIDSPSLFDLFDGGGIDVAFLGAAQIDENGNVNVSRFGGKIVGCGGFINISQNAKKVVFCGSFTAGGLETKIKNGKIEIIKEGNIRKFVKNVDQITYCSECSTSKNQKVLFITERAVFELSKGRLKLIEIAPGASIEEDLLKNMDFAPIISDDLRKMDIRIFKDELMHIFNCLHEVKRR